MLTVDARSDAAFLDGWATIAGVARIGAARHESAIGEPLVGAGSGGER